MASSSVPRKILILDDNSIDRETCRRYLSQSPTQPYEFVEHNALEGAIDMVRKVVPDCILLDYHLRDGNGVEFLSELKPLGGPLVHPVVMLTGTGNESIAVEVMKSGAQDYLVKDRLTPEVLQRAVESAIYKARTDRLLDEQRQEMERLYHEAQEANARKDHFLAALSHELRTPLTPVLVAVSSLDLDTARMEELRDTFAVIRRNIELEARLIDDLLDLTRISRGKFEIDTTSVDLYGILKHAVETCADEIARKNLHVTWNLASNGFSVQADAARLQQVFWNIIKNAVKFTPESGTITISSHVTENQQIEVVISDTGMGIKPEYLEKIFNAFEQGGSEITRRYGGLGLGLAISKALVEAHHGSIWAVSTPDTKPGTDFHVRLRQDHEVEEPIDPATHQDSGSSEQKPHNHHILLVEDHVDSAFFLGRILEKRGYRVSIATSVAEALEIFKQEHIDCVVSDIGLPDASGIELMEQLMEMRAVPGIALSGYGMEQDVQRSRNAGFMHHLTKPVNWQKLRDTLNEILGSSTGQ